MRSGIQVFCAAMLLLANMARAEDGGRLYKEYRYGMPRQDLASRKGLRQVDDSGALLGRDELLGQKADVVLQFEGEALSRVTVVIPGSAAAFNTLIEDFGKRFLLAEVRGQNGSLDQITLAKREGLEAAGRLMQAFAREALQGSSLEYVFLDVPGDLSAILPRAGDMAELIALAPPGLRRVSVEVTVPRISITFTRPGGVGGGVGAATSSEF